MKAADLSIALALSACVVAVASAQRHDPQALPPALQMREGDARSDRDIYGWRLMTHQERDAFRARLSGARTIEECERIQREHYEAMRVRARERGVSLRPPLSASEQSSSRWLGFGRERSSDFVLGAGQESAGGVDGDRRSGDCIGSRNR